MTSLPITRPAPDLPAGPRAALVVATGTYTDPALTRLAATARDAAEMADVLADPEIGSFEVTSVVDRTAQEVRLAVEDFLEERGRVDLVVVYLSCHGLLDKQDRLYFAATDTRKDRLAATGVEAAWLWDRLEECRATSQVVILDCCNSGAFGRAGAKGETDLRLRERFITQGRGRAVLTASRANQRSWEGGPDGGVVGSSVFTSALVEGLRTGAADADGDGYVSVDEAYSYAYRKVMESGVGQVPQRSMSTGEGTLLLARNPVGLTIVPAALTEDLRAALDSPTPSIRVGAVNALGDWLTGPDPARALTADQALRRIAATDVPVVTTVARAHLDAFDAQETANWQTVQAAARREAQQAVSTQAGSRPAEAQAQPEARRAAGPQDVPVAPREAQQAVSTQAGSRLAEAQAQPEARRAAGRQARTTLPTAPGTRLGAVGLVDAGFLILLVALCISAAAILSNTTESGLAWAIIAVNAIGIVVSLGGVRKRPVLAAVVLWNLAWSVVYWASTIPAYSSYSTAAATLSTECIIGVLANAALCILILAQRSTPRRVDPFLAVFIGFFSVVLVLAAIAWLARSLPTWNAAAGAALASVLVGLLVLIRALRRYRQLSATA